MNRHLVLSIYIGPSLASALASRNCPRPESLGHDLIALASAVALRYFGLV